MLNDLLNEAGSTIRTIVDNTNRIIFINEYSFKIVSCSYRLKEILGLYDQKLPLEAIESTDEEENTIYSIQCLSVGNYLSTAILMRINNSYSANFPIIANNADFSVYALSNDFSDITFELVDGNFQPIKLLSPMYLTGTITADIKAETINTGMVVLDGNHDSFNP